MLSLVGIMMFPTARFCHKVTAQAKNTLYKYQRPKFIREEALVPSSCVFMAQESWPQLNLNLLQTRPDQARLKVRCAGGVLQDQSRGGDPSRDPWWGPDRPASPGLPSQHWAGQTDSQAQCSPLQRSRTGPRSSYASSLVP